MKVTIIMPVYNKEKHLVNSIQSVLTQTYEDFELLIINDGSTDNSLKILKDFAQKDNRITLIDKQNEGVSISRNLGIFRAQGDYISFIDADDEYLPTFLAEMLKAILNSNAVYCGHYIKADKVLRKAKFKFVDGDISVPYLKNQCTPNTNSWLINKKFLLTNKILFPTHLKWGEDMTFFMKVILLERRIKSANTHLTKYNILEDGNLSKDSIDKIYEDIQWMDELKAYIIRDFKHHKNYKLIIDLIDYYRIPGAIIYRLLSNIDNIDQNALYELNKRYSKESMKKYYINNFRSFKITFKYWMLKRKLKV